MSSKAINDANIKEGCDLKYIKNEYQRVTVVCAKECGYRVHASWMSKERTFQVAIIPYTYEVTNFHEFKPGTIVNIEFDIIGKYIARIVNSQLGK